MDSPKPALAPPDPEYRLLLPAPDTAKTIAAGMEGAASSKIIVALAALDKAIGAPTPQQIGDVCDEVAAGLTGVIPSTAPHISCRPDLDDRVAVYDWYFAVDRLPTSATKDQILRALVVVTAIVMRNCARLEEKATHISAVEFGLLRESFAVIVESLRELATET